MGLQRIEHRIHEREWSKDRVATPRSTCVMTGIARVGLCQVRVQLERPPVLGFRAAPIPVVRETRFAELVMSLCQRVIELDRFQRGGAHVPRMLADAQSSPDIALT